MDVICKACCRSLAPQQLHKPTYLQQPSSRVRTNKKLQQQRYVAVLIRAILLSRDLACDALLYQMMNG